MQSRNSQKGFTLVELSIVIVIIGLIISGVTAGQTLVKQAQLRAILTQADQVRSAINAFKMQYNGLPGDISNGYTYWSSCGASAAVCNGNGDKQVGTGLKTAEQPEGYIAWWQLNAAGVFPGTYVIPAAGAGAVVGTIGTVIPASRYTGAGITLGFDTGTGATGMTGLSFAKNMILFGGARSASVANSAFLTPAQALSLDAKADDGSATTSGGGATGGIRGGESAAAATTACHSAGVYVVATATNVCTLAFVM